MSLFKRGRVDLKDEWDDDVEDHHDHQDVKDWEVQSRQVAAWQSTVHIGSLAPVVTHKDGEKCEQPRVSVVEIQQVVERITCCRGDHCLVISAYESVKADDTDRFEENDHEEKWEDERHKRWEHALAGVNDNSEVFQFHK